MHVRPPCRSTGYDIPEIERENLMSRFECKDTGMQCNWTWSGQTADEVKHKAWDHAEHEHWDYVRQMSLQQKDDWQRMLNSKVKTV